MKEVEKKKLTSASFYTISNDIITFIFRISLSISFLRSFIRIECVVSMFVISAFFVFRPIEKRERCSNKRFSLPKTTLEAKLLLNEFCFLIEKTIFFF